MIKYQFYNLIPILNVEENIALPLSLDNREIDKEELNEMLKLLGLQNRKKHLPNELSGGQQQRTSIGRALITKPTIILADEPTGNLDSKSSDEIVTLLKKSNKDLNGNCKICWQNNKNRRRQNCWGGLKCPCLTS